MHPIRRRLEGEAGFTMIELMAALFVLSVGIFALSRLTQNELSSTLYTRERDVAIVQANQQMENLRATAFANLQLNPSASIPTSYTDDDGTVYSQTSWTYNPTPNTYNKIMVAAATNSAYVTYQQTVNVAPYTFTVKTLVMGIDDPADGLQAVDQNANTLDYKRVILTIASTDKTNFTYKVESIIRDRSGDPITPVQGIQIEVDDSTGTQVTDDSVNWTIDISGAGILGDEIDEGEYDNYALAAGTYTCTVNNTDTTRDWVPIAQTGHTTTNSSDSFPCVVAAGQINTTLVSQWQEPTDCTFTPGVSGDLGVQVTDSDTGAPLVGATVQLTPTGGQGVNPPSQTTGSFGGTTFSQILTGPYTMAVSQSGYSTKNGINVCVTQTQGSTVTVSLGQPPSQPATVNVLVKWTGGGTKTWRVYLSDTRVLSIDISKNQTATFTFRPPAGTYFVHVYCVAGKKENLRESVDNQAIAGSTTYWYPGPGSGNTFTENKC